MIIIIDLDLQQAVQGFGSLQPAPPIQVKSQDTPTTSLYFAKGNVNYDLGTSPGIRFGLFTQGNPNPLVQYSSFTRLLDAQGRVTYVGYPNFNTVPLGQAIGSQPSLACIGEIRYQTTFGTIARTSDLAFTVLRSLLNETILDSTQVAFTVPAVGSNVTIAISNTSWLSAGLNLTIGNGAGAYQVVSITDTNHFVAQNQGGTGNAAPATVIPSGTSVGIAPAPVIPTYPDPSIIELTTHKGVANGYAGLDANTLVLASRIPVDTQTIAVSGGKIGSAAILATVAANFTTPATGVNVSVTLNSTANLKANSYVRIPIAGYYIVESITSGTVAVLQNNGDPFNAASGVTITTGAVLLPAQAAAGGGGSAGQNAFSILTASFTVPATGNTVTLTMGATAWLGGSGYIIFVQGAGYYAVSSVTDATHAVATNLGYANINVAPGTVISAGAQISPGGVAGAASTSTGANAYDATTASFIMPAAAATVNIPISNTNWLGVGQEVFIAGAGYFSVQSITSPTIFAGTNSNYPGAAAPGATIASGAHVSPAGLIGPAGAGGAGLNAFTTLSASFTQPASGGTVTAVVGTTAWMVASQIVYVAVGGYYAVSSIGDLTHVTLTNLGYSGNAAPAATVPSGGAVSPAGLIGPSGSNPYTTTTASFTMPASGSSVTVTVGATAFMVPGLNVYVQGGGYFTVASVTDATHVVLTNSGASGNVSSGSTVNSGAGVVSAGAVGPAGTGGGGGTLNDATTTTGLSWIANTAGILKRAVAGSSNLTITDTGSTLVLDAPSGGGSGVNLEDPENGIEWTEHFITPYSLGSTGLLNLTLPWTLQGSGTASAGFPTGALFSSGPELSAIDVYTGSAAAIADVTLGFTGNGYDFIVPIGLGVCTWKCKVAIDTLVTSADALIDYFGLFRYNISAGFNGGFYFKYNYALSANWRCVVRTGTGPDTGTNATDVDSGIAVNANTWIKFKVVTNATWTSFAFYINNALITTITTNGPTAATDLGVAPHFLAVRSAFAANKHQYLGYFYLNYPFTN
jgi:hypothetical protein